ncbi:uncharacterized protein LOC133734665 isoform X1 [Rosa rugosa]|uniref:uncharacterized protein LOC133734665 isoform X1 n=1 Tax=Rosa rugosa TaxID=74645 RepID=UPI002B4087F1|nr:uncharacterized protein LOC133734665 isoform X1 [Rosa rugosa]
MGGDQSEGQGSKTNEVQKVEVSVKSSEGGSFGGTKLTGTNFRTWKKIMSVYLRGIHKMGHVTGTIKVPSEDDIEAYAKWEDDDGLVMSILFRAMTDDVLQMVEECETAEAIWKTLGDLYTNESDFIQVHELMCKAAGMQQNGQPVSVFFTKLKNVWAEIDQKRPCKIKNQEDLVWYQKEKELERVHVFLRGLDEKHSSAKGELLRMTDAPSLNTAFTYIRKDESQQESVKHAQVEVSSLAIQAKSPAPFLQQQSPAPLHQQGFPQGFSNRPRPQCSYCNDLGHVRETCWKLNPHLKPKKQGYRLKGKAVAVHLVQEPDFYGVAGQDHHTAGGATPTASIAGRGKIGSSHQGDSRSGVSEGPVVPSGSDIRRRETRSTVPSRFDFDF